MEALSAPPLQYPSPLFPWLERERDGEREKQRESERENGRKKIKRVKKRGA
jgi:hypothetical protein